MRDVVAAVSTQEGGPPASVVLTCPAVRGPYRREHVDEVPRLAGLSGVRIVTEPEAAVTHCSVGRRLGGMDFDEALPTHVDARCDGAVSSLDPNDPEAAAVLAAVRAMCVRAKEELSTEPDVLLRVPLPSGGRGLPVTRLEFNDMIRPAVAQTTEALHLTIASAGLTPGDLGAVLLAGGSSRIPLVPQMVSAAFGRPVRVGLHPRFTVALGAAEVSRTPVAPPAPPAAPPVPRPEGGRPRWPVPVAAAAAVLVAAASTPAASGPGSAEVKVWDGGDVARSPASSAPSRTGTAPRSAQRTPPSTRRSRWPRPRWAPRTACGRPGRAPARPSSTSRTTGAART